MLTPQEKNLLPSLLQRHFASDCVDFAKIKSLVPREVECKLTGYKTKVVEIVFDPFRIEHVNARFKADGYIFDDSMKVVAVTEDGSILLWGGLNSVYHIKRGETITGAFDEKHLGFQDLLDFTQPFKTKRKKVEIDEMLAKLKDAYGGK
jgi:hypothetical protein